MTTNPSEKIWTRAFVLLCLAEFLGYAHNALLTPTLPLYVTHLGSTPFWVGVVLAAFSVTSVFLRPLIGSWADSWSYAGILSAGALLLGLSVLLYLFPMVATLVFANSLRGIGWAGLNTGGYSMLANNAPNTRRGEASGLYGAFQSCPHIFFPALALWLIDAPLGGFIPVILLSAVLAFTGSGIALLLKQRFERPAQRAPSTDQPRGRPRLFTAVDPNVLVASALLLSLHISFPVTTGFLVLYTREIGIQGLGWYFLISGITQVLTRPTLGLLSDRIGRGRSVAAALLLELGGLLLLSLAPDLTVLVLGGMFYAAGTSMGTATTMAMAITLAEPSRRGAVMATFSTALPMSMGLGAMVTGIIVEVAGYSWMFVAAMAMVSMGLLLAVMKWSTLDPPAR
ncbi:MAG TPA: MFS transporter [Candidatus Binatia bacterium]